MSSNARKPEDRKPKQQSHIAVEPPAGAELLKPITEVPVWEQRRVVKAFMSLTDGGKAEVDLSDADAVDLFLELAEMLVPMAYDADEWAKWCSGHVFTRLPEVIELIQWYILGEMGPTSPSQT